MLISTHIHSIPFISYLSSTTPADAFASLLGSAVVDAATCPA
jgi:hypothetical protein